MCNIRSVAGSVAAWMALALAPAVTAGEWPHWRGPDHDGVSSETGLESRWDGPPPTLWEQSIGSAFSGISCVDGRAYTCGTQGGQQVLFCLDADRGDVLWQRGFEQEYRERQGGDGTRATPTVEGGRVYIQGARGRLVCLDARSGQELWSRQFHAVPQWGYSGSVLIEGNLAIVNGGDKDGALVAVKKTTGDVVWKCGRAPAGYATPYPFALDGQRYVVGFLSDSAVIVDPTTGRQVWNTDWKTDWDVNAATPILHAGSLFLSSGYNTGSALFKLSREGEKLGAEQVWKGKVIAAKFQTPVVHDGHLYVSDQDALKCVEFATGRVRWSQRKLEGCSLQNGTIVLAEGRLFILSEDGWLLIAPASPDGFEPASKVRILSGRCWTVPTLYRGRLYARNFEKIICLKLTR